MSIALEKLSSKHRSQAEAFKQACLDSGMSHIPGAASYTESSFDDWLAKSQRDELHPQPGRVSATLFVAFDQTGVMVGVIQLRHELNEFLLHEGGHIGYAVHPDFRGRGLATEMLQQCLVQARAMNIQRLLITCDDDNIASEAVIRKCGGRYEDTRSNSQGGHTKRFWIELEQQH